ncbi:hypothetical protein J3458_020977 [Metarhizium acridum]|uniref:uncharacterized protein n=1 Tax=Metarhizium acridum TaxID=92637 RepID=UPI001C6AEC9D|nr:hypothetical protein J3458_020977 [Metarhizium acridum]
MEADTANEGKSIEAFARQCLDALQRCLDSTPLKRYGWAENTKAEFLSWTATADVFGDTESPLDSRLEFEPDTKNAVVRLLSLLLNSIQGCQKNASEQEIKHDGAAIACSENQQDSSPTDDPNVTGPTTRQFSPSSDLSSSESGDEDNSIQTTRVGMTSLDSAKSEVDFLIRQLKPIDEAMGKPKPNPILQRADGTFQSKDYEDLRDQLTVIVLAKGSEEVRQYRDVDRNSLTPLQERLIKANLRRRHMFLYAQKDARNFEFDPQNTSSNLTGPVPDSFAKTALAATTVNIGYPRPPKLKEGQKYFRCPYCCQVLPEMLREDTLWEQHVREDISPYTCIIEGCEQQDALFVTRAQWMKHILSHYPECWECQPCGFPGNPPRIFPSVQLFLNHTKEAHGHAVSEDQYPVLVAGAARPGPTDISDCPLCDFGGPADSGPLLDHIAEHLYSFSLLSLPCSQAHLPGVDGSSVDYLEHVDGCSEDISHRPDASSRSDGDLNDLVPLPSDSSIAAANRADEDRFLGAHLADTPQSPMPALVLADTPQEWEQEVQETKNKVSAEEIVFKPWEPGSALFQHWREKFLVNFRHGHLTATAIVGPRARYSHIQDTRRYARDFDRDWALWGTV